MIFTHIQRVLIFLFIDIFPNIFLLFLLLFHSKGEFDFAGRNYTRIFKSGHKSNSKTVYM